MIIHTSPYSYPDDPPFVARFNNSQVRELYDVYHRRTGIDLIKI